MDNLKSPTPGAMSKTSESPSDAATTCPRCGESRELAKVKGCIRCLACGFKFDCNGW